MQILKNLALTILSTTVALIVFVLLFEVVASWRYDVWKEGYINDGDWYEMLTVASDNPVLLWEYRPNAVGKKWDVEIVTNSAGFRDREHELEKPEGVYRVAFLGDSVTVGIGIQQDAIFPRRFEELANAGKREAVESLSFAVDSYDGLQVMELARTAASKFNTDLLVYVVCMNDFDFGRASARKKSFFKKPDSFFMILIDRLKILIFGGNYYRSTYEQNGASVLSEVVRTRDYLAIRDIELVVVLMPIFKKTDWRGVENEKTDQYVLSWLHSEITNELESEGIAVLDLSSVLESKEPLRNLGLDSWHLNELGHKIVAESLVDSLLD
jgi:lysophospholipase L1-like esterase